MCLCVSTGARLLSLHIAGRPVLSPAECAAGCCSVAAVLVQNQLKTEIIIQDLAPIPVLRDAPRTYGTGRARVVRAVT